LTQHFNDRQLVDWHFVDICRGQRRCQRRGYRWSWFHMQNLGLIGRITTAWIRSDSPHWLCILYFCLLSFSIMH